MFKTVCVIGLGYIGLPTSAVFANAGFKVIGVDVNHEAIKSINNGEPHIFEPGLVEIVNKCVKNGSLIAKNKAEQADVFIIAVPTPFKGSHHEVDLEYIQSAVDSFSGFLKKGDLIILESTSPPGTTEFVASRISDQRPDLNIPQRDGESSLDIFIAHCPERVLPGRILYELIENDRVIGGINEQSAIMAQNFYKTIVKGKCYTVNNTKIAELTKLAENSFRDVNIAFANELANICDELETDVWEVIKMANLHPRVNILSPGPGVGGHCIAVDPWFIVNAAPKNSKLIKLARNINDERPNVIISKVIKLMDLYEEDIIICYGLAFKPNIDDLRESPAVKIFNKLCTMFPNKNVIAIEPHINNNFNNKINAFKLEEALKLNAIHVLLVDHDRFKYHKPTKGHIIDTRGVWN
jgi:UDP-N-acetyl-D-mannosaminuronic acid dehydrogenase